MHAYSFSGANDFVVETFSFFNSSYFTTDFGIVSSKIFYKRDYFNFEIVNYPFLGGEPLPMVYIFLQLIVTCMRKHVQIVVT